MFFKFIYTIFSILILKLKNVITYEYYNLNPVSYIHVLPNSFVCICTPSYIVSFDDNNLTDWDGICSNDQVCYWNSNEIIVKHWNYP